MPNEDDPPSTEARHERDDRHAVARERVDEGGGRMPGGAYDPGTAPPPGERDKTGEPRIVSPRRKPDDVARAAGDAPAPRHQDRSGRPEQPQDRPPGRT